MVGHVKQRIHRRFDFLRLDAAQDGNEIAAQTPLADL